MIDHSNVLCIHPPLFRSQIRLAVRLHVGAQARHPQPDYHSLCQNSHTSLREPLNHVPSDGADRRLAEKRGGPRDRASTEAAAAARSLVQHHLGSAAATVALILRGDRGIVFQRRPLFQGVRPFCKQLRACAPRTR